MVTTQLLELFAIGIATPLTAACVIPLYPAFIGYLAATGAEPDLAVPQRFWVVSSSPASYRFSF